MKTHRRAIIIRLRGDVVDLKNRARQLNCTQQSKTYANCFRGRHLRRSSRM